MSAVGAITLDGKAYSNLAEMCVIADDSGAIGLGGVMGGASTGCSIETTDVFLESAWFDPGRTAKTGRATGSLLSLDDDPAAAIYALLAAAEFRLKELVRASTE